MLGVVPSHIQGQIRQKVHLKPISKQRGEGEPQAPKTGKEERKDVMAWEHDPSGIDGGLGYLKMEIRK